MTHSSPSEAPILNHNRGCRRAVYVLSPNSGTLPWLLACSAVLGGCGAWSEVGNDTYRRVVRLPGTILKKDKEKPR